MKERLIRTKADIYRCSHCTGVASILISKHTKKGTWPEIEFCPFCGFSNMYLEEYNNDSQKALGHEKLYSSLKQK